MLNKSGVSGHPCFLLFEVKLLFFTIEYNIISGFVIYNLYYVEVLSPIPNLLSVFNQEKTYFVKIFCIY